MVTAVVMAKPPIEMSRIPKLATEGVRTDTGMGSADSTLVNSAPKTHLTRIPALPPAPVNADINSSVSTSRSRTSGQLRHTISNVELTAVARAETAAASTCNSPKSDKPPPQQQLQKTTSAKLASKSCSPNASSQLPPHQRPDVLQHHLKIAEAVRQSLEADLRDARFSTSTLQTQVLGLQSKCEKLVEQQVMEIEKLDEVRKEAVKAREGAMAEVQQLRQRLADATANQMTLQRQLELSTAQQSSNSISLHKEVQVAVTPAEHLIGNEHMANAFVGSVGLEQQLHLMKQHVEDAEQQLLVMKVASEKAAQQHAQSLDKVQHDLQAQRIVHDTTAAELLTLKAAYDKLQRELQQLKTQAATAGLLATDARRDQVEDNYQQLDPADEVKQEDIKAMTPDAVEQLVQNSQTGSGAVSIVSTQLVC
eukprot:gene10341-10499_t